MKRILELGGGGSSGSLGFRIIFFKESVVILTFRDIFGSGALLSGGIVDEAEFATLDTRSDAVQANEEFGAIGRIGEFRMRIEIADGVGAGAFESVDFRRSLFRFGITIGTFGLTGPIANAAIFVEPQTGRTSIFFGDTINASIEDVTDTGVGMRVESVQSGTQIIRTLRGLKFEPISAVDVEIMIARFAFSAERVEDETVGTVFGFGDAVEAFVVFVALLLIFVGTVGFFANAVAQLSVG